jgi:hypothetical protein
MSKPRISLDPQEERDTELTDEEIDERKASLENQLDSYDERIEENYHGE